MSSKRSVFVLSLEISASSCVIQMVLHVYMAIAAIEMPKSMKHFGHPCIEISVTFKDVSEILEAGFDH
jgi:hypothetical protein